jgi:RHS repeat-associated protein
VDGFGRTIRVQTPSSIIDTQYAPCACSPLGKMSRVSQPYASGSPVWTSYTYDGRGRPVTVTGPDGSVTSYTYQGNQTTVTDPAGKWKTNTTDALGNLISVTEPNPAGGNIVTNYVYDAFNHLTQVSGAQTRTFQWDTYSGNMLSATNPENGTVTYSYNGAHQVTQRTDAKGQQTQYTYDGYGRLSEVRHYPTAGTEDVNQRWDYSYDGSVSDSTFTVQNGWGRLSQVTFGGSALSGIYMYSYNQAGRVIKQRLQVPSPTTSTPFNFDATYAWDNEGRMTSLAYPNSGPVYAFGFDSLGRLSTIQENNTQMATAGYNFANQMTSLAYDTLSESRTYDPVTLQLNRITSTQASVGTVMDMGYNYVTGQNNGRISSASDYVMNETVNYTYDALNRLSTAQATNNVWGQAFTYDVYGNLTGASATVGSAPYFSASYDGNNHQSGYTYDANGNAVSWLATNVAYDVENRMTYERDGGNPYTQYTYDPAGKRVSQWQYQNSSLQSAQVNFYAITGQRLATYTLSLDLKSIASTSTNLYFGGRLIRSGGVTVATDRLGSVRANVNGERMAYWPYGQERTSTSDGREKFGTYFRDAPGQDYADQRYFNATLGRFWTPDPGTTVNLASPASWNKYTYVHGDPINFNDPGGMLEYCPACGIYQDMISADVQMISPTLLDPFWGNQIAAAIAALAGGSFLTSFPLAPGLTAVNPAGSIPVRNKIGSLEQNLDPACQDWLETSPVAPTAALLVSFMDQERNGGVGIAQFVDSLGNPSGVTSQAKLNVAGFNILINSTGPYFATNQAPSGIGNLNNGTSRFQIFVLLHEFAHQLGVPGFLPEGGILGVDPAIEKNNNQMIFDHCGKTLAAFSNGMA